MITDSTAEGGLDDRMRAFEKALERLIPSGAWFVARLDGRGFTRLTNETMGYEKPFDARFRDAMVETVKRLMDVGFDVDYAYTQSDEISLLFHPEAVQFGRRIDKYESVLAGEASAALSLAIDHPAPFDCRVIPLPDEAAIADYFMWRQADARRNAINGHAYWLLRRQGHSARKTQRRLEGMNTSEKRVLLADGGIDPDALPHWQTRGIGAYRQTYTKQGFNPLTGETVEAERRRIVIDANLPVGAAYREMVAERVRTLGRV